MDRTQFYSINSLVANNSEIQLVGQITDFHEVVQSEVKVDC